MHLFIPLFNKKYYILIFIVYCQQYWEYNSEHVSAYSL